MSKIRCELQVAVAFGPVNMATAANNGDWIALKKYQQLGILLVKMAGGSGEPPTLTIRQATDSAGTSAKALNFTTVWVKDGADLTAIGTFTKTTQASGNTYAPAAGDTQTIALIYIDADELDIDGGFCFVQASVADVGSTAQLGTVLYILGSCREAAETMPSAIA